MNWRIEEVQYLKNSFPRLPDRVLSKYLDKSPNAIRIKASRLNLRKESVKYREKLKLSKKEEQVILGSLLGDLHCRKTKTSKNPRLEGGHYLRQKEYLMYKVNLLRRLKWQIRKSKKQEAYHYESKSYFCLNKYYNLFYKNNKRQISKHILAKIERLGLLIWYLDDGSYHRRDRNASLHTNNFSYNENTIIQEWFQEKWGISPSIYRIKGKGKYESKEWHHIAFSVKDTWKLQNLFQDFNIPECMRYKLSLINHSHSTHLRSLAAHN